MIFKELINLEYPPKGLVPSNRGNSSFMQCAEDGETRIRIAVDNEGEW